MRWDGGVDIPREFSIRESEHRIHDPFGPEKLAVLGAALRMSPGTTILDLASGSGEMLCTWARDHAITGTGVDLSTDFTAAARRRAAELGVGDRVDFLHGDAAAHRSQRRYDVVSCLGASWIGGGPLGTLDLLEQHLVPGGLALLGEPFWVEEPDSEEAVRGSHARSRDDFRTLPGLVAAFADHGWDVVEMVLGDRHDWDRYVAAQWLTTRRWLDANPDDELHDTLRAELDRAPYLHVRYARRHLGWGVFALMKR